jgi:hypothetical protein
MTAIPLHIQRRIEQRWASRFTQRDCVKRPKECWNQSRTINGSTPAAKTKEKPAGLNRRPPLIVRMMPKPCIADFQ